MLDTAHLAPGTRIAGRYTITRELGRGASKRVYLAQDTLTGLSLAVAVLSPEYAKHPVIAARFSRESKAAAALRSPFIVQVFDVGKLADDTRYLVLEAVIGRGMDEAINDGYIDPQVATRWILELLAGLCEAHAKGVIHRDLKPENIMLAPTEVGECVKLTDFGLAKVVDQNLQGSLHMHTAANTVLGTPDYMPPEQWRGDAIDERTDLYAVGVILYELLAGVTPFAGDNTQQIAAGHLFKPPPPLDRELSPMALALEGVLQKSLQKRKEDRYQNAIEMAQAIAAATGVRVPNEAFLMALPLWLPKLVRAELLSDALDGPLTVVVTPWVVMGRDESAHVKVRCLPPSPENTAIEKALSRRHASVEWRGGRALIADLESAAGTTVDGHAVTKAPFELRDGAVIALGDVVQFGFAQAAAAKGELPAWARLERLDPRGKRHTTLMLMGEKATLDSSPQSAVRWSGDVPLTLCVEGSTLLVQIGDTKTELTDGAELSVGSSVVSVAL
jgi:serine/threonine protein kinase